MNRHTANRPTSAGNPIANVLVAIVVVLTIGAFIVLGVVAAVALGGVIVVLAAILGIRMWWLGRKLPNRGSTTSGHRQTAHADRNVIEGDFHVVSGDKEDNRSD